MMVVLSMSKTKRINVGLPEDISKLAYEIATDQNTSIVEVCTSGILFLQLLSHDERYQVMLLSKLASLFNANAALLGKTNVLAVIMGENLNDSIIERFHRVITHQSN